MNANACDVVYTPVSPTVISADVFILFRVMLFINIATLSLNCDSRVGMYLVLYLMGGMIDDVRQQEVFFACCAFFLL